MIVRADQLQVGNKIVLEDGQTIVSIRASQVESYGLISENPTATHVRIFWDGGYYLYALDQSVNLV